MAAVILLCSRAAAERTALHHGLIKAFSQWPHHQGRLAAFPPAVVRHRLRDLLAFRHQATPLPDIRYSGVFILMALLWMNCARAFSLFLPLLLLLAVLLFLPSVIEAAIPHISKPYYREMLAATRQSLSTWYYPFFAGFSLLTCISCGEAIRPEHQITGERHHFGKPLFHCCSCPCSAACSQGPIKEAALLARGAATRS